MKLVLPQKTYDALWAQAKEEGIEDIKIYIVNYLVKLGNKKPDSTSR